jgi:hypothetical protein
MDSTLLQLKDTRELLLDGEWTLVSSVKAE